MIDTWPKTLSPYRFLAVKEKLSGGKSVISADQGGYRPMMINGKITRKALNFEVKIVSKKRRV
jgi:hypothetical protein